MFKKYDGFSLIELVIVIVVLGILAVIAIPNFIDLSRDEKTAAVQEIAGALSSANAMNYASRKKNAKNGQSISNCTQVESLLVGKTLPSSYVIESLAVTPGVKSHCTVTYTPANGAPIRATFTATGIT